MVFNLICKLRQIVYIPPTVNYFISIMKDNWAQGQILFKILLDSQCVIW